mgnify:CR=1 FL=1
MKKNIRMTLEYDGSRYDGWQKQGNTDKTIQGKLEQILLKMTGEEIEVHGSGRTDAGVHAKGQVANFHIDWKELEKNGNICNDDPDENVYSRHAKQVMPVFKAMDGEKEAVPLKESCGRICGEFAYIYPPGIPIVAPGEWISRPILEVILEYRDKGLPVQGPADQSLRTIRVVQKD